MFAQWSHLPIFHVPPLLVKHDISSSAYDIQITDLTHIWTETLDRRQIIRRALDESTSIDPSEGAGQLMKLLQEIEKALKGQPDTNLNIQHLTQAKSITLEATVVLPSPFPLLRWNFCLSCASQESLTSNLLLPCLAELLRAKSEVASLLTHIQEKDHVINRLREKLEASGIELIAVFPSAAPPRRSKTNARELVLASVKGLREFNIPDWRHRVRTSVEDSDIEFICGQVFKTGSPTRDDAPNGPRGDVRLDEPERKSSATLEKDTIRSSPSLGNSKNNVEEFQRQIAPVPESVVTAEQGHTRQDVYRATSESTISGSETSDDDLEGPVVQKHKNAIPKPVLISDMPKKLGVLGGKKQQGSQIPSQISLGVNVSGEGEPPQTGQLEDNRVLLPIPEKSRPKLGRIGGVHKEGKLPQVEAGAQKLIPSASTTGDGPSIDVDHGRSRRQSVKKSVSPPPPRETSQERANRNRARLKRELEEKNKAPVKKKRKF